MMMLYVIIITIISITIMIVIINITNITLVIIIKVEPYDFIIVNVSKTWDGCYFLSFDMF